MTVLIHTFAISRSGLERLKQPAPGCYVATPRHDATPWFCLQERPDFPGGFFCSNKQTCQHPAQFRLSLIAPVSGPGEAVPRSGAGLSESWPSFSSSSPSAYASRSRTPNPYSAPGLSRLSQLASRAPLNLPNCTCGSPTASTSRARACRFTGRLIQIRRSLASNPSSRSENFASRPLCTVCSVNPCALTPSMSTASS